LNALQNFSQTSTGFTASLSYPIRRSFKRLGLTYSFDVSSINVFSDASRNYFQELNFRNVSGPDALKGVVTSSILPSLTINTIDNPQRAHSGKSLYIGGQVSGLGGNVAAVRPIIEWKQFIPMKGIHPKMKSPYDGKQALGYRIQASFISGYGGHVAPPFERFYLGGDTDIRGFDIRSISPLAFFVQRVDSPLVNPDNPTATIPKDPNNPRRGSITIPLPVHNLIFPGGDTSIVGNLEYRIPIAGPVTLAPFVDFGMVMALRPSQLQINTDQLNVLNSSAFGCPGLNASFDCVGGLTPTTPFQRDLQIVPGTNYQPRMSTGLELQVIMPIVNAPFRIYYAYNPLRLNETTTVPSDITRSMFPPGGAGDFSFQQALASFAPSYILREPSKTFRFTVSTTF
jgi:outer membrane protein insertion porin family